MVVLKNTMDVGGVDNSTVNDGSYGGGISILGGMPSG